MENGLNAKPKLNLFALPNQTTILFWMMVAVVLGTVFAGSIGTSPIPIWPLAVALLFLPLRAFLARPERDFHRHGLKPAGDAYAALQAEIRADAAQIGLSKTPQLVVSSQKEHLPIYTFGTFRHWYIAVGRVEASALQASLADEETAPMTQARLIHELYHFKTGDYWQLGYVGELLRLTFKVMAWAAAFFLGFGVLLLTAKSDFMQFNPSEIVAQINAPKEVREWLLRLLPSQASMEAVHQKAATLNLHRVLTFVVGATWPFAILGGGLWWFYWPRLWRMREFYADAGVVHTQKEIVPFRSALIGTHTPLRSPAFTLSNPTKAQKGQYKNLWETLREWWGTCWNALLGWWQTFWDRITESWQNEKRPGDQFLAAWHTLTEPPTEYHPDALLRITAVSNPSRVFPSWKSTAFRVGSLTLMLEILTLTPLTMLMVAQWPLHFPILAALVIISLNSLIPAIVQGRSIFKETLKMVGIVVGLKLAVTLFVIGYLSAQFIWAPDQLDQMLEDAVAVTARFAGNSDDLGFDDLNAFVIQAAAVNLVQVFIAFATLLGGLAFVAFLLRRLLTWYGFQRGDAQRRLMKAAYGVIGLTCLFLALTLLPLLTNLFKAMTNTLRAPDELPQTLILEVLGLIITGVGLGLFLRADQKYANQCPACGAVVEKPYEFGKCCQACHERLHPWLIAEYDT